MDKIKLELKDKNDAELLQWVEEHITAMTGNANFSTPLPPPADFLLAKDGFKNALSASNAAQEAAKQKTILKDDARAALENAVRIRASYIESTSEGDPAKILSSNMQVRAGRTPIGPLPAPVDFLATMGDMEGEIDVIWSRVKGAKSYILEMSPYEGPRAWTQVAVVTKSKTSVENLTRGNRYVFRVCAVGSSGSSPWSDESAQMAP